MNNPCIICDRDQHRRPMCYVGQEVCSVSCEKKLKAAIAESTASRRTVTVTQGGVTTETITTTAARLR